MTVELRQARQRSELQDVFALRHRVFSTEEGRLPARPDGRLFDRFDSFPETVSLIAYVDGQPAGSIRITMDGPAGTPLDDHYDLTRLRARCDGLPTAVVTSLCVRRDMRGVARVTGGLLEAAVDVMVARGAAHVVAIINPLIAPLMRRLGLAVIGAPMPCPRVGQALLAMHAPMTAITVPRLPGASLGGALRYLRPGEPVAAEWAVVLAGQLRLSGASVAGPGAVVPGGTAVAVTPAAVRVLSAASVRRYAAEAPEDALSRAAAIQPARAGLFDELLRARVIGALDAAGVMPLLDGSRSTAQVAEDAGLRAEVLDGLLGYLEAAGLLRRAPGWAVISPERAAGELALVQWLQGGYGGLLDALVPLLRGEVGFSPSLHRDDGQVAAASAAIGRRLTDAQLVATVEMAGVRRIADVGCGSAERLVGLCQALPGLTAVAVDQAEDCCRLAVENIVAAGLSERIAVVNDSAERWAAGAEPVDLVVCVGMFHDLLNTPGAAAAFLAGVRSGLAPGGMLLIQDQLTPSPGAAGWGAGFALLHRLMGQRLFTETECLATLSEAGFRLIRTVPAGMPDNRIFLLEVE